MKSILKTASALIASLVIAASAQAALYQISFTDTLGRDAEFVYDDLAATTSDPFGIGSSAQFYVGQSFTVDGVSKAVSGAKIGVVNDWYGVDALMLFGDGTYAQLWNSSRTMFTSLALNQVNTVNFGYASIPSTYLNTGGHSGNLVSLSVAPFSTPVPEPESALFLLAGLGILAGARRRAVGRVGGR